MVLLGEDTSNTVSNTVSAGRTGPLNSSPAVRAVSNSGPRALHQSTDRGETGFTEERNENVPGGAQWALHDEVHSGC